MGVAVLQQCPQDENKVVWIDNYSKCSEAKRCNREGCIYRIVDKAV